MIYHAGSTAKAVVLGGRSRSPITRTLAANLPEAVRLNGMDRRDETLREIALLTFPGYKGSQISIDAADHIDRRLEDDNAYYIDWLVDLAHIKEAGPNRRAFGARYVLPLSSGVPILPGQSAQITSRCQAFEEFRCQRLMISNAGTPGGAADWIVNDIRIGSRSQFSQSGDVPGDMFATAAIDNFVSFDTVRDAMDVIAIVTYIGPVEVGVPFFGSMIGTGRSDSPHYVRVQQPYTDGTRTKIPVGFAYVSQRIDRIDVGGIRDGLHYEIYGSADRQNTSITIYVPPIDQATIDVAVDATLADGKPTQAVDTMIEHALDDRAGLVRDAYVALVVQRAGALSAGEAQPDP